MEWNYNMKECPKSYFVEEEIINRLGVETKIKKVVEVPVILASADCLTVTTSRWLPKENRWNMFSKKQTPLAWMPFPSHPKEE